MYINFQTIHAKLFSLSTDMLTIHAKLNTDLLDNAIIVLARQS